MASVYRTKKRNGKFHRLWRFKFRDHTGKWRAGTGWPDKQKTLEHAQTLEAEHRAIRKGEKELPPSWLRERNRPIEDVIKEYMEWGRATGGLKGHGWSKDHAEKRAISLRFWVSELQLRALADIDLGKVEARSRKLLSGGLTGKTVAGYVEGLKALCTWAVKHGFLKSNPLQAMSRFDVTPKCPHRAFTEDELRRLLEAAPPERRLIYKVALCTGYRAGELRALKVKSLDVFGPSLRLGGDFTKNRRDAEQPIQRELAAELQETAKTKGPDMPLLAMPTKATANENFRRDLKKARIKHITDAGKATFHSFRKNYINSVVSSGSDLKTIMTLARHGSAQMSMETYAKAKPERLRAATEAVSEELERAIAAKPCHTFVKQAVGAESQKPGNAVETAVSGPNGMVALRGFEPRSSD